MTQMHPTGSASHWALGIQTNNLRSLAWVGVLLLAVATVPMMGDTTNEAVYRPGIAVPSIYDYQLAQRIAAPRTFLLSSASLMAAREGLSGGDARLQPAFFSLLAEADKLLTLRPASVMDKPRASASGDKYDYFNHLLPLLAQFPQHGDSPALRTLCSHNAANSQADARWKLMLCAAPANPGATTKFDSALPEFIRDAIATASQQYRWLLAHLPDEGKLPRTFVDGKLQMVAAKDWTSGFFPGSLWYLYQATGDAGWRTAAGRYTALLEQEQTNSRTHDVGFILNCSYGNGYRLTRDPHYREVLIQGAHTLSTRFKPEVGLIRSWDHGTWKYPVIIDNMMNLELLTWAAREANEPGLRAIAIRHADNTLKNHFRPDASTWHVVDYNPTNGAVMKKQTHQGAADDSAWARGQAWGLYGYTMMYREARHPEYLAQAAKIARFLMKHPRLPEDKIPYWDFDAPNIPNAPRDASAAAIMASALLELADYVEDGFGGDCRSFAQAQLRSLASPAYLAKPGENGGFLLRHCVGNLPKNSEVDVPLNYADYYFLEALLRYRNLVAKVPTSPAKPSRTGNPF